MITEQSVKESGKLGILRHYVAPSSHHTTSTEVEPPPGRAPPAPAPQLRFSATAVLYVCATRCSSLLGFEATPPPRRAATTKEGRTIARALARPSRGTSTALSSSSPFLCICITYALLPGLPRACHADLSRHGVTERAAPASTASTGSPAKPPLNLLSGVESAGDERLPSFFAVFSLLLLFCAPHVRNTVPGLPVDTCHAGN